MDGSTRYTIDLFAASLVVVAPLVVVAIGRWAAHGAGGRSVSVAEWLVLAAALLSGAAGLIHLLVIEEHLAESWLHAGSFAGLAAFQLAWAIWYPVRPRPWLRWAAVAVNLGAVVVWALSRTVGLPGWLDGGEVEPVGLADLACTVMELALVAAILALLWQPMRSRVGGRGISRADAGLGMAMVSLAIVLVTLGAIASIAVDGHEHAGGSEHESGVHTHAG